MIVIVFLVATVTLCPANSSVVVKHLTDQLSTKLRSLAVRQIRTLRVLYVVSECGVRTSSVRNNQ